VKRDSIFKKKINVLIEIINSLNLIIQLTLIIAYFDSENGVCYRFNSGFDQSGQKLELKRTKYPGGEYGLSLTFIEPNENVMPYTDLYKSE
jgi:hypothetical protein